MNPKPAQSPAPTQKSDLPKQERELRYHIILSYMLKHRLIGALCFSMILMAVVGCKKKAAPAPPPEVQVITLTPTNVPIFEEWIGTLDGFVNAQIHAQVTGYLLAQNYREGGEAKK